MRLSNFLKLSALVGFLAATPLYIVGQTSSDAFSTRPTLTGFDNSETTGGLIVRPPTVVSHWAASDTYTYTPVTLSGHATVVGYTQITTPLTVITGVEACLNTTASLNAAWVSATVDSESTGKFSVYVSAPTSSTVFTPIASTTSTLVSWTAHGW